MTTIKAPPKECEQCGRPGRPAAFSLSAIQKRLDILKLPWPVEDMGGTFSAQSKECEECGRRFSIHRRSSYAEWVVRRFCSATCAGVNKRKAIGVTEGEARQEAWKLYWRKREEECVGVIQYKEPAGEIDGVPVFKIRMHDPAGIIERRIPLKIQDRRPRANFDPDDIDHLRDPHWPDPCTEEKEIA